jgi:hypothetical protein
MCASIRFNGAWRATFAHMTSEVYSMLASDTSINIVSLIGPAGRGMSRRLYNCADVSNRIHSSAAGTECFVHAQYQYRIPEIR